jgi:phosphopantothenoylcysteine decarboxylase
VSALDAEGRSLLVGACGAANVLNLPSYLQTLRQVPGLRVRVIMTPTATRFVPVRTVRLVSDAVFCDGEDNFEPGHARLADWADLFIVLPATAHVLAQAAQGYAGSLLTATLLAYEGSVIFFPSMNAAMWRKPAVQRNVAQLAADRHRIAGPVMTQCWEIDEDGMRPGLGLPSPSQVAAIIKDIVTTPGMDPGQGGEES